MENKIKELIKGNKNFALLHTGKEVSYSDKNSFLFFDEVGQVNNLGELKAAIERRGDCNLVGWVGYEAKNQFEKYKNNPQKEYIKTPEIYFNNYQQQIDLDNKNLSNFLNDYSSENYKIPEISFIGSNMTDGEYIDNVEVIRGEIITGNVYQANLTRKYFGEFKNNPDGFALFSELNKISPAPYSSYIKAGDLIIISSSPELFLKINENGEIVTCPIKGSANSANADKLAKSGKDRSENLMITDLMRNDISRVCEAGSIRVEGLFETSIFKTISHMHSTITGKLKKNTGVIDILAATFPPGSMTGAPKISAVELCAELEDMKRGIYSGVLGVINNGLSVTSCQFSVVIRTLIIQGNKFEFQVGGGIVYDSDPYNEIEETFIKAAAIKKILGINGHNIPF